MKNMRISRKLLVGFMVVTLLSVILAGVGIYSSSSINSEYTYLLDYPVTRERHLHQISLDFTTMRYNVASYIVHAGDEPYIRDTIDPRYNQASDDLNAELTGYLSNNSADTVRDPAALKNNADNVAALQALIAQYDQVNTTTRGYAASGDLENATASFADGSALASQVTTLIDEMLTPAIDLVYTESATMDVTALTLIIVLCVITVLSVAISVTFAVYISGIISKPITLIANFMKKAGDTGEIELSPEQRSHATRLSTYRDEIGDLSTGMLGFVGHVDYVATQLESVSGGDLTVDVKVLSDRDTMGVSMKNMLASLNNSFGQINIATEQVAQGSMQIANAAQSLAQGSTEQAATVEELSGSTAEISDKTKTNAEMAESAARMADTIKQNAEKGSKQMNEMMSAVGEITQASQSIGRVIKVIDDIAFQTNILALNAAVEAARAGQHGKGFAVVSEEVRNLAAKSAEAAKDTGSLIQNSIEKAELGARIAKDTAASLDEIVAGINENGQIISQIASSSEEQSEGVVLINTGIDQVTQVVQQNSATAEESAAASQQLSSQAAMLERLMKQFKLKASAGSSYGVSASDAGSYSAAYPEESAFSLQSGADKY